MGERIITVSWGCVICHMVFEGKAPELQACLIGQRQAMTQHAQEHAKAEAQRQQMGAVEPQLRVTETGSLEVR